MRNIARDTSKLGSILLFCLASAFPLVAQMHNLTVPVTDSTGPNNPLAISGDITFRVQLFPDTYNTQWDMNITLTNISSKTIVAYQVAIEAMPDQGTG